MKYLFLLLMLAGSSFGQTIYRNPFTTNGPVDVRRADLQQGIPVILDDDYDDDMEDLAGLQLAAIFQKHGFVDLIAVGNVNASVVTNFGPGLAKIVGDYWGIAPRYGQTTNTTYYQTFGYGDLRYLGTNYGSLYATNFGNVIYTYRKALAESRGGVVFIVAGQTMNLADLLNSPADGISAFTGRELVSNKVAKIICIAGDYPNSSGIAAPSQSTVNGAEFNLATSTTAANTALNTNVPPNVPIIYFPFSFATNFTTFTMPWLTNIASDNPVFRTYTNYLGTTGRSPWTEIPMLYLATGTNWQNQPMFYLWQGSNNIAANGSNWWTFTTSGKDYWVSNMQSVATVSNVLNAMLCDPALQSDRSAAAFYPQLRVGEVSPQTFKVVTTAENDDSAYYVANVNSPSGQHFVGTRWQINGRDMFAASLDTSTTQLVVSLFTNGVFKLNPLTIQWPSGNIATVGGSVSSISVGASPFTYTNNDGYTEVVWISGGTISRVDVNGVQIGTAASPGFLTVILAPNETVKVTYSGGPGMEKKPL